MRGKLARVAIVWSFLSVAAAAAGTPTGAWADHCAEWGEACDAAGTCIRICVRWGDHPPPFEVKKSGETAAPGTVTPSQIEEIERKERLEDDLKVKEE